MPKRHDFHCFWTFLYLTPVTTTIGPLAMTIATGAASCAPLRKATCAIQRREALKNAMTERLMSAPAIGQQGSNGSVHEVTSAAGPRASIDRSAGIGRGGSIGLVLVVAVVLVAAATAIVMFGGARAEQ